ncbi:HAUS augmin-like complex subunit 6 [Mortierella sp. AD032]|nr:HAUS augmin-like complex subunit 6 [Mortierella sp. AD032]
MTRSVFRPQLQQTITIDSCGYDATGNTKPLELHRHVFAKGHQSTKALEFVLWFLFSRLDKSRTRDRFKECWPVLDRHDAREFRNVAFKWLEELRKDGCFGVGHQLARDDSSASLSGNNATSNSNTNSNAGGLGLFLPTIRRSYLDESIGERIEQLVLVLSTYVLSTVIKNELLLPEDGDRTIWELIIQVPESIQDEAAFLESIDSQIVCRSQSYLRDVEHQKAVRMDWNLKSQEMRSRLDTYSKEFMNIESERRMFLVHQPHIADRTGLLSLEELQVLEDHWIEKINDQWRPILRFVERHVERKDFLQALLDADSGSGSSVLDGKRLQKDPTMTLGHLANHGSYSGPSVDLVSILKIWKHSLHQLESETKQDGSSSEVSATISHNSLENLSRSHAQQLEVIKGTRTRLENRLNEVTKRVERLKRCLAIRSPERYQEPDSRLCVSASRE